MSSYWDKSITVTRFGNIPYRMYENRPRRIDSLLSFAHNWINRSHIIQGERIVTFAGLLHGSAEKGRVLIDAGVSCGDHVVLLGWNSPDWVINFWACLRVGAIPVLANAWWSDAELAQALDLLQPRLVLADRHGAGKLAPKSRWSIGPWDANEKSDAVSLPPNPSVSLSEHDPAVIIFTSGTQGRAKAVVLPHRTFLANQQMLLHVTRRLPYKPDPATGDIGLHTGPLFHIGGVHALIRAVLVGNTLVFGKGRFEPGEALELIERHRIVRWAAVPTMATRLLEHPEVHRRDISSLTAMTLGGAPVHPELLRRIRTTVPSVQARIATGYGLSENGGQATTASGKETSDLAGTTGRPMPLVELKTISVPGLPDGEILIRSPTQMLRYYGSDESPIDLEGWLHTGDLGKQNVDGYLWITGRCKDLIIRGGENIAPAAVEQAIAAIPGVTEAAVFGVPHADLGEEVMAVVVVEDDLSASQIEQQVRKGLASFAVPSLWHIQKEPLPVNQTGKIDKTRLRRHHLALRSSAESAASEFARP